MRLLPLAILVVLAIYCWFELAQSDPAEVRRLPRLLWALVILVPLGGPVAWLVFGRPNGEPGAAPRPPTAARTVAPDDDPEFLRNLRIDPPKD